MLKQCSNKLAFSKTKWYMSALHTIAPITKRSCAINQHRGSATLLEINPLNTATPQPMLPRLEPVRNNSLDKGAQTLLDIYAPENLQPKDLAHRCSAFKKIDGKQCRRTVIVDSTEIISGPVYCYQHDPNKNPNKSIGQSFPIDGLDATSKETDLSAINDKLYDCWDLWIHPQLAKQSKGLIRQEITKPVSECDQPGYVYAYSLEKGPRISREKFAYFKIGRTYDPHRRMYQITHMCDFVPKIVELFPSFPKNNSGNIMSTNLETLDGKGIHELPKCPISHRVERLILLELNGLFKKGGFKCPKCGSSHREWFKIERIKKEDNTLMTDKELFDVFVRPTILRWIQYGVMVSALIKS